MRTETRTVNVGEYLGPVDWKYDFDSWGWDKKGGSCNPDLIPEAVNRLARLEQALKLGETWEATTDGGAPRCGWGEVLEVGMYDGWPHWKPTPSILIASHLGSEWSSWFHVKASREDA